MSFLGRVATRIINEVRGINRVVYDITSQAARDDRVGMRAMTAERTAQTARSDSIFFPLMAVAMMVVVFIGFSRTYYLKSYFDTPSLTPLRIVHGAVFTTWMVLFIVQTGLVAGKSARYSPASWFGRCRHRSIDGWAWCRFSRECLAGWPRAEWWTCAERALCASNIHHSRVFASGDRRNDLPGTAAIPQAVHDAGDSGHSFSCPCALPVIFFPKPACVFWFDGRFHHCVRDLRSRHPRPGSFGDSLGRRRNHCVADFEPVGWRQYHVVEVLDLAYGLNTLIPVRRLSTPSGKAAPFLPMSRAEMTALGWDACDIVLVTGDAYVDHPSFGMAIIGRLLEAQGFRVGIIAQPDWQSAEPFKALGKPRLFFGVTGGNLDSMVNRYTADRRLRHDDAYTAGGEGGKRPDRCTIVYTQRCREAYKDVPIVLGGIEASLRRIAHYDYWSDKVRRSILADAKADLLIYGNAERAVVEVANRLAAGEAPRDLDSIRGVALFRRVPEHYTELHADDLDSADEGAARKPGDTVIRLPAYEQVEQDKEAYARASRVLHRESQSRQRAPAGPAPRRPRPVAEPAADPADHRRDGCGLRPALRPRAASRPTATRRSPPGT